MDQDVSAAKTGGVNEVVAQGEVLRQVLVGTVGGQDAQVMFVLKARAIAVCPAYIQTRGPIFPLKHISRMLTECKRRAVSWMARMCVISKRSN